MELQVAVCQMLVPEPSTAVFVWTAETVLKFVRCGPLKKIYQKRTAELPETESRIIIDVTVQTAGKVDVEMDVKLACKSVFI